MFNSGNCASVPLVANIDGCGNGGGYGNGMWGENGLLFIIVLALLFGWGNNGWGNNGGNGGGNTQFIPYQLGANYTDAAIQRGFDNQAVVTKLDGITQGICDSTYALNASMQNGFAGVNQALCQGFNGVNTAMLQGFNGVERGFCNVSAQLAQCCCDNREAISQVRYDMAAQACDTRQAIAMSTRDIVDSQNAGTRAVLEKLGQMEYNNLNDKYQAAIAENQSLKFAASQSEQNAFIAANQNAQTAELIRRLGADCPTPAYVVQPPQPVTFPTNCCGGVNFANYGGNGCSSCGC